MSSSINLQKEIQQRLEKYGVNDPVWNQAMTGFMVADIDYFVGQGMSSQEALEAVFDHVDPNRLRNFGQQHPIGKIHLAYKVLLTIAATLGVVVLAVALVLLILGYSISILLILTGLVLLIFVAFPVRILYRTRKERMEKMYRQIYLPGEAPAGRPE